ncbi:hypothetical protein PanWU01x14_002110 [Parasponia andersonii]|uniref:Uncharacterized protein n=1 Tax=Parasponia andersonii TaxID=3476 RepID=A0A2P5E524_PARAD|nr:hypothetical protein PanWU01x14_002110 [Parasponia andersonii]
MLTDDDYNNPNDICVVNMMIIIQITYVFYRMFL